MRAVRHVLLLVVPAIALLFASGCQIRGEKGLSTDELRAENARLNAENADLKAQNDALISQLAQARADHERPAGGTVKDLLGEGEIPGASSTPDGGIALDEDFLFAKGSAELGEAGKKTIGTIAERLNKGDFATSKVIVEGHTDDTPVAKKSNVEKYVDNWGLSAARSATVVRELQHAGVAPDRIRGAFRGEFAPRGADKAHNRRVELFVR